eukprot:gene31288-53565_t
MCYSAQLLNAYDEFVDIHGAVIDIEAFAKLYGFQCLDDRIKVPKAMAASFSGTGGPYESAIKVSLDQYRAQQATKLEQELFKQRTRLADAERTLLTKTTKAATESKRIATSKVNWAQGKSADTPRTEVSPQASRIYPSYN